MYKRVHLSYLSISYNLPDAKRPRNLLPTDKVINGKTTIHTNILNISYKKVKGGSYISLISPCK